MYLSYARKGNGQIIYFEHVKTFETDFSQTVDCNMPTMCYYCSAPTDIRFYIFLFMDPILNNLYLQFTAKK
jgi:hypothetical protein